MKKISKKVIDKNKNYVTGGGSRNVILYLSLRKDILDQQVEGDKSECYSGRLKTINMAENMSYNIIILLEEEI